MMPMIQPYVWRHFCLENENIAVSIDKTKGGYIEIPREFRIQGAKPANSTVLTLLGLQGGFLCNHTALTVPTQGTLLFTGTGWFYKPNPGAHPLPPPSNPSDPIPPDDTFSFKLTYFGQDSPTKNVLITLF